MKNLFIYILKIYSTFNTGINPESKALHILVIIATSKYYKNIWNIMVEAKVFPNKKKGCLL